MNKISLFNLLSLLNKIYMLKGISVLICKKKVKSVSSETILEFEIILKFETEKNFNLYTNLRITNI